MSRHLLSIWIGALALYGGRLLPQSAGAPARIASEQTPGNGTVMFSRVAHQTEVRVPRLDEEATIDGKLDEPAWGRAAMLTGFSQFQPIDGIPADDSTQVLVWYSPHAIYFGIRAFEAHGAVHATLADRD